MFKVVARIVSGPDVEKAKVDGFERKELLDLYIYQSNLFWKLFAPVGVIELATFTGWYAAWHAGGGALARLVLLAGAFVMLMQMALIFRAGQYLASYGEMIAPFFTADPPRVRFGITGRRIGLVAPGVFIAMHVILGICQPWLPALPHAAN